MAVSVTIAHTSCDLLSNPVPLPMAERLPLEPLLIIFFLILLQLVYLTTHTSHIKLYVLADALSCRILHSYFGRNLC